MADHGRSTGFFSVVLTCVMLALTGSLGAEEPFDYFRNSWSVIGLRDYTHATRVTPQNELLVQGADSNEATLSLIHI